MEELSLITTSRRNPHSTWSSDWEVVVWDPSRLNQLSLPWLESSRLRRWSAESAMSDFHQRLSTAERESVVITETSDQRRRLRAESLCRVSENSRIIKRSYKIWFQGSWTSNPHLLVRPKTLAKSYFLIVCFAFS